MFTLENLRKKVFPFKSPDYLYTVSSCYLEHVLSRTNFLAPGRITVAILNFSEIVAHRNLSMKIFSCVFKERVCLIECYFS